MVIFKKVETPREWEFYWGTRRRVFVENEETALFYASDRDEYDNREDTEHFVSYNLNGGKELVGALRVLSAPLLPMMKNLGNNFGQEKKREVSRLILPECFLPAQTGLLRFLYRYSSENKLNFLLCECRSEIYATGLANISGSFNKLPSVKIKDNKDNNVRGEQHVHPVAIDIPRLIKEVEQGESRRLKRLLGPKENEEFFIGYTL